MAGTRPLTESEQIAVTSALERFPLRDQTLVTLMKNLGFRISELLALNVDNVWEGGRIRSRVRLLPADLKGGRGVHRRNVTSRSVLLNTDAAAILEAYIFSIFGSAGPENMATPLFRSRKRGRLSRWQANRIIHAVVAAAGIRGQTRGELSSHALRKTFCTNVYRFTGNDINLTRAVMGHRAVSTTQAYLEVRQGEADAAILGIGKGANSALFEKSIPYQQRVRL